MGFCIRTVAQTWKQREPRSKRYEASVCICSFAGFCGWTLSKEVDDEGHLTWYARVRAAIFELKTD